MRNIFQPIRLIRVADMVSLAERFAVEIDWQRVERHYPQVLDNLALFHWLTPLSETLLSRASLKIGQAPQGIGAEFEGWPRYALAARPQKGYGGILRDTFSPSEWWLRFYYGPENIYWLGVRVQ